MRLSCTLWGHVVDNEVFSYNHDRARRCRQCGLRYLDEDGTRTHVRHTVSCFLRHHTYVRLTDRDGIHEYVCVRCGHPLVFPPVSDRFAERTRFTKRSGICAGFSGTESKKSPSAMGWLNLPVTADTAFSKKRGSRKRSDIRSSVF